LDDAFPLLPQRIISDLESVLEPDDLVISDVGAHKLWVAKRFRAQLPNTVIISNGFAAMGIGLPGAIAAKLAEPGRPVAAVPGDGPRADRLSRGLPRERPPRRALGAHPIYCGRRSRGRDMTTEDWFDALTAALLLQSPFRRSEYFRRFASGALSRADVWGHIA